MDSRELVFAVAAVFQYGCFTLTAVSVLWLLWLWQGKIWWIRWRWSRPGSCLHPRARLARLAWVSLRTKPEEWAYRERFFAGSPALVHTSERVAVGLPHNDQSGTLSRRGADWTYTPGEKLTYHEGRVLGDAVTVWLRTNKPKAQICAFLPQSEVK